LLEIITHEGIEFQAQIMLMYHFEKIWKIKKPIFCLSFEE